MRLILAGGGTGGHLFPGLAVAREFLRRDAATEILFVGSERGIENRILPQEGFSLESVPIKGIKGRGVRGLLEALYCLPISFFRSLGIITRFRPQCIIGLGGYASAPLLLAAALRRIRCGIMEQNLRPGLTNRLLGWVADRVFTSFKESISFFPRSNVVETGTPVRWQELPEVAREDKLILLVFGGSGGAHRLNMCILEALSRLKDLAAGLRIVHQTGTDDFERVQEAYASLPFQSEVCLFIDEMDRAYARADLIVCRAGASTIAEIAVFGRAAILIPYPYAADDHQRLNAQALERYGAAEVILEQDLSGETLAHGVRDLYLNRGRRESLGEAAKKFGRPEAAKRIVDECYALLQA